MKRPHVLIVGCGDLGQRLGLQFVSSGWQVSALRRRPESLPDAFQGIRGDYTDPADVARLTDLKPDYVVFTPLPAARDATGYERGFAMATALLAKSGLLAGAHGGVFVSSTRVYAEVDGGWVDEDSPLTQSDPSAASIIAAEQTFLRACPAATVLRASGIYGDWPGMFIERLTKGYASPAPDRISNRIHRDDLVGIMVFCLERLEAGLTNSSIYNASDQAPTPIGEIESWLTQQLNLPPASTPAPARRGNRRCSSERLCRAGYKFAYHDYRAGFSALIAQHADKIVTGDTAPTD